jgi:hypothetical protein
MRGSPRNRRLISNKGVLPITCDRPSRRARVSGVVFEKRGAMELEDKGGLKKIQKSKGGF